jgi:hypothetical protein
VNVISNSLNAQVAAIEAAGAMGGNLIVPTGGRILAALAEPVVVNTLRVLSVGLIVAGIGLPFIIGAVQTSR